MERYISPSRIEKLACDAIMDSDASLSENASIS